MRHAALAFAAVLAGCSGADEGAVALGDADVAEIRRLHDAYASAWLAGDRDAVMRCFSTDAVLIPHHGVDIVQGEKAMREFFWPKDAEPVSVSEFTLSPDEIKGRRDLAFARGRFRLQLMLGEETSARAYTNAGNYLMVLRRDPDGWRITRYIWNDPAPQIQ